MCKTVNCGIIAGIIGAVFGIIIGILFYLGTITAALIVVPIIIAISIAIAILLLMIISLTIVELGGNERRPICLFENAPGLVITSVLTILAGIASFAITLASGSVIIALLIGIGAALFLAMLILLICYLVCITNRRVVRD